MPRRKVIILILLLVFSLGLWWGSYKIPSVSVGAAGSGWITDRLVDTDVAPKSHPSMATDSNGYLWVAYELYNSTTGHYEIHISSSADGGDTWVGELRAYNVNYDFRYPSIAIDVGDNNKIYVAYEVKVTSTNHDIYVLRYIDGNWDTVTVATTTTDDDRFPSITSEYQYGTSDYQYISWERVVNYNDRDLMFAKSTNDGTSWTTTTLYGSTDTNVYSNSTITNAEGYLYIAYRFGADYGSVSHIGVVRFSNRGSSWSQFTNIDNLSNDCSWPSIVATHGGSRVVVAFQYKYSTTNDDVYYSYSTDYGLSWYKGNLLATTSRNERTPTLAVDGGGSISNTVYGYVHIAYWDNNAIKYRKALYTTPTTWSTAQTVNSGTTVSATYSRPAITTQYRNGSSTYYAGVAWTDTRGTSTDIYYSTPGATYTIAPSPTGLKVTVDNTNYTASTSFNWVAGYNHTLSVSSPQSNYYFISWSDGGAQSHKITVGTTDTTLTATLSYFVINLRTKDWSGNVLPSATVSVVGLGNITSSASGWANFTAVPPGTYTVKVYWRGSKVNQTSITITTLNKTMDLRSRVYSISFVSSFKDSIGNTLYTNPSSFKLIAPNGTTTTSLSASSYYLQNGTFRVSTITWNSTDITPSPSPTFDPTNGNPTILTKVFPHRNMLRPYDWPMFHQNPGHAGYSTTTVPDTMSLLWNYTTGGSIYTSSPSIRDGILYIGSSDYYVYAINASTGARIWRSVRTGGYVYSSPAVVGGIVYFGSTDNYVYALNASTGKQKWKYNIGNSIYSSPTVADGKVYVAAGSYVYALDASTGKSVWNSSYLGSMSYSYPASSPAVAYGKVYIGAGSYVYALNETGGVAWSYLTTKYDSMYYSSPAVYEGKVYISGYSYVYALNASTGAWIWDYSTGSSTYSSPAVADGKVYFSSGYHVYCLDADNGEDVWDYSTGWEYAYYSSPAVADGKIYVGAGSSLYALNATTGSKLWSYMTGNTIQSSPAIAGDKVYVGSNDNKVYAFGPTPHYSLKFKFMDNGGTDDLTKYISWVLVQSPTGKILNLTSYTLSQAEAGEWRVTKIVYMMTNVVPTYYTPIKLASDTTWTISCRIYLIDFTNTFQDNDGNRLSLKPSNFTLLWPYGKATSSMTVGKYYLQNGTFTWKSIFWQGTDVTPIYTSTFNPEGVPQGGSPTINCRVYKVDFTNTFQDPQGARLNPNPDNFRLLCPNGTTTQKLSVGSYQLQAGTYTFKNITWQGQDVTPSPLPTFDPASNRNPTTRTKSVKLQTTISCQLSRTSITSGESLTISGVISPAVSSQVTIQISTDGGNTWGDLTKVTSAADGRYSYTWTPPSTGTYRVRATWLGNAQYLDATSTATLTLTVSAPPPVALPSLYILGSFGLVIFIAVIAAATRRRKPKVVVPPPMDPRIRLAKCRSALAKLEDLRKQGKVSERVYRELRAEYEAEAAALDEKIAAGRRR